MSYTWDTWPMKSMKLQPMHSGQSLCFRGSYKDPLTPYRSTLLWSLKTEHDRWLSCAFTCSFLSSLKNFAVQHFGMVLRRSLCGFTPEAEKNLSQSLYCRLHPYRKNVICISGVVKDSPEIWGDIWASSALKMKSQDFEFDLGRAPQSVGAGGALRMLARRCW